MTSRSFVLRPASRAGSLASGRWPDPGHTAPDSEQATPGNGPGLAGAVARLHAAFESRAPRARPDVSPPKSTQPEPLPIRRTSFRPIYTRALPTQHLPRPSRARPLPSRPPISHISFASHVWHSRGVGLARGGRWWSSAHLGGAGRGPSRRGEQAVISLRRMTLGSGYRYLMESVAVGDGAPGSHLQPDPLLRNVGDPARRVLGRRPGRPRRRPRGRAGFAGDRAAPVQSARDVRRPDHRPAARPPAQPRPPLPGTAGGRAGCRHSGRPTPAPNGPRRGPASRPRNGPRAAPSVRRWPGST